MVGGTWCPTSRRRGWLGEVRDVTEGPSKRVAEWLDWYVAGGVERRAVTLY